MNLKKASVSQHIRNCFLILLPLALLLCLGCSLQSPPGNIVDDLGRRVNIDTMPHRIISLAPSNTEILFAIGLSDRVVGVTEYCNYPEGAIAKPKVGGFSTVDIEKVVSLEPDLVLATQRHSKTVIPALEELGVTVLALAPGSLSEAMNNITLIGEIAGQNKQASQLVDDLRTRIEAVADKTQNLAPNQRPRVLYLTWHDPLMTAGTETLVDDIISKAGGQNIAYDISGDKAIDLETVIYRNPQVIIASIGMGTGEDLPWQYVRTEPRLKNTEALLNDRVYKIDGDLVHRPGPRIVEALELMAQFINPELFEEIE
ncbi:MAG TPA: cobalamin-binding protein [Dehalococcoidia bacterium]|nr:cobalamin-binding protein [Dehalococcoidia bacterium]